MVDGGYTFRVIFPDFPVAHRMGSNGVYVQVRLLKWLKHPSILSLFDTFLSTDGRLVCLTTTYCESGDLAKIVKHSSRTNSLLGEKTVLGWFAQVNNCGSAESFEVSSRCSVTE